MTKTFASVLLAFVLLPVAFAAAWAVKPTPSLEAALKSELRAIEGSEEQGYWYVVTKGPLEGQVADAAFALSTTPEQLRLMGAEAGMYVERDCVTYSTTGKMGKLDDPTVVSYCHHRRMSRKAAEDAVASSTAPSPIG